MFPDLTLSNLVLPKNASGVFGQYLQSKDLSPEEGVGVKVRQLITELARGSHFPATPPRACRARPPGRPATLGATRTGLARTTASGMSCRPWGSPYSRRAK